MRANRIFARMLEGQSYAAIAEAEGLSVRRVREIVQQALDRWDIEPSQEYTLAPIARLDSALRLIERKIAEGKLSAAPHLIKVLEQLDAITASGSMRRRSNAARRTRRPPCGSRGNAPPPAGRRSRWAPPRRIFAKKYAMEGDCRLKP
jgi:hypothetical protein